MSVEWFLSSSVMILLVVIIRFAFRRKIRPCVRYALWLIVLIRLLVPGSFLKTPVSVLNLLPESPEERTVLGDSLLSLEADAGTDTQKRVSPSVSQAKSTSISQAKSPSISQAKSSEILSEENWQAEDVILQMQKGWTDTTAGEVKGSSVEQSEELPSEKREVQKRREFDMGNLLRYCWLTGAGVFGLVFLAVNINYSKRLLRSRKRIANKKLPAESNVPVYIAEVVKTPCLSGLFHPSVYVTEEVVKDEKIFTFVLCHENIHYKHLDNWWAFVRILCLCLHWFNPFVWLAVRLSRQDGELACDEEVIKGLGNQERADYGRSLLKLSTEKMSGISQWQITTTMRGSRRQLGERLQMIVNEPVKALWMWAVLPVLLAVILAFTFTGRLAGQAAEPEAGEGESLEESAREDERNENITSGMEEQAEPSDSGSEDTDSHVDTDFAEEINKVYGRTLESKGLRTSQAPIRTQDIFVTDLNFDGWDDLCIRDRYDSNGNIPCYCMLWNQQKNRYEYSITLNNVEIDLENQLISSKTLGKDGGYSMLYCRYDTEGILHMLRYREENTFEEDTVFRKLDLTYVDDKGMYTLPAVMDEENLNVTMIAMAKQALTELYQWTGEKIDTVCFRVNNVNGVSFAKTPEDMEHSRIFYDRYYGAETKYNLDGYEKSISSHYVVSGKSVWYSPVNWRAHPDNIDEMTDEDVVIWYFERMPAIGEKVKSTELRFGDTWTTQTESGRWYEVIYDAQLREVVDVIGPYDSYPVH